MVGPWSRHPKPDSTFLSGIAPTRPLPTTGEAGNYVPPRGFLSRTLTFQVPDSAHDLELTVEGGDHPLPLKLGPSPAGGHSGH